MSRIKSSWMMFALLVAAGGAATADDALVIRNCRVSLIHRASLAAERLGVLDQVRLEEGDSLKAGQVVATLRNDVPRQVFALAEKDAANTAELRLAKKVSELATLEYSKAMELNQSIPGGHSEIDIKKLRLAAEKSLLQIEQADFRLQMAALKLEEAKATLAAYDIVAPFAGEVLSIRKQAGEAVSPGEVVAEIANFDVMRVEGFVPVNSVGNLTREARLVVEVSVTDPQSSAGPRVARLEGRLKFVSRVINEVSQEVRVVAEVPNENHILKDGLPATMRFSKGELSKIRPVSGSSIPVPPKR